MWEREKIEEVREIKYLGYILQKNGPERQIREGLRKAMVAIEKHMEHRRENFLDRFQKKNENV